MVLVINDCSVRTLTGPTLKSLLEHDKQAIDTKGAVVEKSTKVPIVLVSMNNLEKQLNSKFSTMTADDHQKLFDTEQGRFGLHVQTNLTVPRSFRRSHPPCRHCAAKIIIWVLQQSYHKRDTFDPCKIHEDSDEEDENHWCFDREKDLETMDIARRGGWKNKDKSKQLLFPVNASEFAALQAIREQNRLNEGRSKGSIKGQKVNSFDKENVASQKTECISNNLCSTASSDLPVNSNTSQLLQNPSKNIVSISSSNVSSSNSSYESYPNSSCTSPVETAFSNLA